MSDAAHVLDAALHAAATERVRAHARIEREYLRLETDPSVGTDAAIAAADAGLASMEAAGDQHGQARAWWLRAYAAWTAGQVAQADTAWERAGECARRCGDQRELFGALRWRATAAVFGPTPVDAALARCAAFRELVTASPFAVASMVNPMATLHAMRGDFALAELALQEANATLHRLGGLGASVSHHEAVVRMLADEPARGEATLRAGLSTLREMDDSGLLATTTAMLAQAVYAQGRSDEAEQLCRQTADAAGPDDIVSQTIWRTVMAKVLAADARGDDAMALAQRAVALAAATDLLSHRADAMLDLAEVLWMCSRWEESRDAVRGALSLYERKGNAVGAARAAALLSYRERET